MVARVIFIWGLFFGLSAHAQNNGIESRIIESAKKHVNILGRNFLALRF